MCRRSIIYAKSEDEKLTLKPLRRCIGQCAHAIPDLVVCVIDAPSRAAFGHDQAQLTMVIL